MSDFHNSYKWKKKRAQILRRDRHLCRDCQRYGKHTAAVTVHHILPYDTHPELGLVDDNLVSLCEACHNRRHPEKGTKGLRHSRARDR